MRSWVQRLLVAVAASMVCGVGTAGPPEDHEAGLQAYRRGDVTGAMLPLRRAADAGHAPSQTLLAFILDSAGLTPEAIALYRRAAEQGHVDAEVALGALLADGRGAAGNPREAFQLFARAADRGDPRAIRALADIYLRDDRAMLGDEATDAKALAALRRAGEMDHAGAVERLVRVYREGQLGVAADAAEAARWQARLTRLRPGAAERRK